MKYKKKHKVGDHVILTKVGQEAFNTKFITGVVRKVNNYPSHSISVKRDRYKGHEFTWWGGAWWRKMSKKDGHEMFLWPCCKHPMGWG